MSSQRAPPPRSGITSINTSHHAHSQRSQIAWEDGTDLQPRRLGKVSRKSPYSQGKRNPRVSEETHQVQRSNTVYTDDKSHFSGFLKNVTSHLTNKVAANECDSRGPILPCYRVAHNPPFTALRIYRPTPTSTEYEYNLPRAGERDDIPKEYHMMMLLFSICFIFFSMIVWYHDSSFVYLRSVSILASYGLCAVIFATAATFIAPTVANHLLVRDGRESLSQEASMRWTEVNFIALLMFSVATLVSSFVVPIFLGNVGGK